MKIDAKFWTIIGVIISFVALCITIVEIYLNREKQTILEIKKISEIELTRPLEVARLSSMYLYDSIPVAHLWQVSCVIKNAGEVAILGDGFANKNIRGHAINLHIINCEQLLSVDITGTNTDAVLLNDTSLKFTQWRPNEYVELLLLSDGPLAPEVTINDRDIQNATITNVKYSPQEQLIDKRLMDKLPMALSNTLWWITIIAESISLLILLLAYIVPNVREKDNKNKKDTSEVVVFIWIIILILLPIIWMF